MFVDPSGASRNQTAVLIKPEQNYPIVNRARPLTTRQQVFQTSSQITQKSRYIVVTPADENHFSLVICTQVSGQIARLIVAKMGVDFQFGCVRKWLDCQTRPMALL